MCKQTLLLSHNASTRATAAESNKSCLPKLSNEM